MEFGTVKRELKDELNKLISAESKIDASLSQYFGLPNGDAPSSGMSFESRDLSNGLAKIESAAPLFEAMLQDSKKLALQVEDGGSLSDRLSSIVRRLDMIQIRAQQALACTEDIMNMKDYKIKLCSAIENDDLVQAVAYIRQVQEIDVKAASASDDYHFIMEKKKEVRELVRQRFNGALEKSDDIKIVMSLCPLLNTLELENEARDDFIKYVEKSLLVKISGSDDKAAKGTADEATGYANTLLDIFNTAFLIIQQNLPMIIQGMENSYGDIYFIRRLHARCEDQAGSVLKRYMKFRRMRELIDYTNGHVTTPASGTADRHIWTVAEVHSIMDELALHIQYCTRYLKYLRHICKGAETKKRRGAIANTAVHTEDASSSAASGAAVGVEKVFPGPTPFDKMKDELVNKYYLEGEKWLMRQAVRNILPDSIEEGIGMRLDESFFVLQKCSLRAIATNDIHSACSILHFISELISTDLLAQATQLLLNSSSKVGTIMQDHMTQFKRITLDRSNLPEASFGKSASNTIISSGLKTAFLGIGGSAAAAAAADAKDNNIHLHEDGGFWVSSGGAGNDLSDPWGVSALLEAFSLMELCSRYTDRLGSDIWKSGQGVFTDEDDSSDNSIGGSSAVAGAGKAAKGAVVGGGGVVGSKGLGAGLSSIERLRQCKEEIDSLKLSFSKSLKQGADRLVATANTQFKDLFATVLGRGSTAANASTTAGGAASAAAVASASLGLRFDEEDQNFDGQPGLNKLPKALTLPIETIINICTYNLGDKIKDLIVGLLVEVCCENLEALISKMNFRYNGALKMEEISRTLSTLFSRFSTVPVRGKFSRLREIMMVLTTETKSSLITDHFTLLTTKEIDTFLSLRLDLQRK